VSISLFSGNGDTTPGRPLPADATSDLIILPR
jgi:hypothetical protein